MARSKWISFGAQQQLDRVRAKAVAANPMALPLPSSADAKKFGLENFGNTCYANSVLQALYFCTPFRDLLLQDVDIVPPLDSSPVISSTPNKPSSPLAPLRRKPERKASTSGHVTEPSSLTSPQSSPYPIPSSPPTLFSALQSLFLNISTNPGDKGTVSPRAFIDKLKELNDIFRSTMHQDAHEFLNYLLNKIVEEIEEERKQAPHVIDGEDLSTSIATLGSKTPPTVLTNDSSNSGCQTHNPTFVHKLFEGVLTSETRCLTCETVSSRDESFLDLSIDIEQNSSVTACLRQFSASEMLCQRNKFFCDSCCDLQEAEKRMKIKRLPNVLALHLKRFKYQEDVARYIKLAYRVAFPFELRLFNTVDDIDDADRLYNLFAIVVHIGNGPHHGHYISIIKTVGTWLVFDDDNVYPIPESDIPKYFGESNSGSAYVLYYQAVDIDPVALGLRAPETFSNTVPPTEASPALLYQQTPILPPGLNTVSIADGDGGFTQLPPPANMIPLPETFLDKPSSPVTIAIPHANNVLPSTSDVTSSPKTPTAGIGSKLLGTIRRTPSISTSKGTFASNGTLSMNSSDIRRSLAERSPRASTSTPTFIGSLNSSLLEPPPPVPPLPPNNTHYSQSPITPTSIPQVHEPDKEKVKEKSKGWFKRKSLRVTEKSRQESSATQEVPSSPIHREELQPSHLSWFKPSSSTISPRPQRLPSENGSASVPSDVTGLHPDSSKMNPGYVPVAKNDRDRDYRLNGKEDNHLAGSASSSPGSYSVLNNLHLSANVSVSDSTTRPSTSSTNSGLSPQPHLEIPPTRKSSLVPSSTERSHTSFESKRSSDLRAMSPSTFSPITPISPSASNHFSQNPSRSSPTPKTYSHHRSNMSNGTNFMNESDNLPKGKMRSTDSDFVATAQGTSMGPTLPRTAPPVSLAASVGTNNSSGSANSASSGFKRATRKLSLTAPMLGFGKRDKDRDKEREEKTREREKDRLSPNTSSRF
ncbi:hypothetical protein CPB84DRAFT_1700845 [Gymnopilus junonius]|uniref:Ubiquitin carboxyl-terminal hydrolase n=1 Tax=Gymnopilus junonius TaxID=109634 RepID=A0A9P5TVG7_GYMJU|nr:hypothetical protein CPB84DRAFT_1700845 [Gymnopilus junonius]